MGNADINKDMARHPLGEAEFLPDGTTRLVFVRHYHHPVARVWRAITDPAETRKWWAESRGELTPGSSFSLRWLNGDEADLEWWDGKVLAIEEPRLFELTNSAHGLLRFELEPAEVDGVPGTRVTFTNVLSAAADQVTLSLAGWHTHLDHLQEALEGRELDWPRWYEELLPAWEQIHRDYAARGGEAEEDHSGR